MSSDVLPSGALPPESAPVRPADPVFQAGEDGGSADRIRPRTLDEFIGQPSVVANLRVYIEAARSRGEPLDHILFSGMPGLGKTTLAHLVAGELGSGFRATSGPVLEKAKDLVGLLTDLESGDVLFIDEIHRLNSTVEEYLYSAMEDYAIDILIDQGPNARSVKLNLHRFTLVAATTREGNLTSPLRSRFGIQEKLDLYPPEELEKIIERSAGIWGIELEPDAISLLARRCRGTPRLANRYLRRVRDFAEVERCERIGAETMSQALARLGVDDLGLDALDRRILRVMERHGGGPVGVKTISVTVGEDERTIEDVYEPFLIRMGFLVKTPRGRILGPRISELPGFTAPRRLSQGSLFEDPPNRDGGSGSD